MGLFDAYDPQNYPDTSQDALFARVLASLPPEPPISTDNSNAPTNYSAGAAPAAFGAGASPFLFAGPGSLNLPPMPSAMDANAAMPAAAPAPQPQPQPADEDDAPAAPQPQQASPLSIGRYQMPRVGPAAAFELPPGQLDPNTGNHVQPAAPAPTAPDFGSHLSAADQSFRHGGGLIGGITSLITGQRHDPQATWQADQNAQQQKQAQQLQAALIAGGMDSRQAQQLAVIHAIDPEAGRALIQKAFGPPQAAPQYAWDPKTGKTIKTYDTETKDNFQVVQTGENGMGGKSFSRMNKADGTMTPIGAPGADNGGGIGDMSLTGPEYLATVPKKQALTMKGMVDGTIQPPTSFAASKPYWQNMIAGAKNLDPNFDENAWAARHKLSTDLASSGNSTMGGILSNGESSFKHLAEYTASAADQGNASHNFIGGGYLAHAQNYIGNSGGGSDAFAKVKAINDNLGHYGQESTKFYAGTGGGVEERMNALKEMDPTSTSGEESAAYAEKEKGLMLDRLNTKFQEIRNTFGDEQGNRIIAKHMPDIQKNIATIDANIARLRGGSATGGTAPGALPAGWSVKVN